MTKEDQMKAKRLQWTVMLAIVAFFVGICMFAGPAAGQEWTDVVQQMGMKGKVDWSRGTIEAVGIGAPPERYYGKPQARPMALRAAQLDAYRNLLEVTEGVQIDSRTMVKDYVTESDEIRAQISGMVKGAQIAKREYLSDGTVEVTLRMNLHGGFSQTVLPREIRTVQTIATDHSPIPDSVRITRPTTTGQDRPPVTPVQSMGEVYTGLVIDARGITARPAMAPKIIDEDGREVYGSAFVSREYAVSQGMSGYSKDLTAAQSNQRVTDNPLTVKGLKTEGPGKCNVVISKADAAKIRGASENLSFLKKCHVMIVLD